MDRPLLIFDGDCGFCRYCVEYARRLTGEQVRYEPYQSVADQFDDISRADLQRSIYLIEPDGGRSSGAEAAFRTLAMAPEHGSWRWCYEHISGFGTLTEALYTFVSQRRVFFHHLSRGLIGPTPEPASYTAVSWLYLRVLAIVYLIAFVSFGTQVLGLIGSAGILPLEDFLRAARDYYGIEVLWRLPMVFWIYTSDPILELACIVGAFAAVALFLACYNASR